MNTVQLKESVIYDKFFSNSYIIDEEYSDSVTFHIPLGSFDLFTTIAHSLGIHAYIGYYSEALNHIDVDMVSSESYYDLQDNLLNYQFPFTMSNIKEELQQTLHTRHIDGAYRVLLISATQTTQTYSQILYAKNRGDVYFNNYIQDFLDLNAPVPFNEADIQCMAKIQLDHVIGGI